MSFIPCSIQNVNNQYLTNVFCVAETLGLNLPVYQVEYDTSPDLKTIIPASVKNYILMICGNENHESVEHYLEDTRIKMIVKNYPRMINLSDEYKTYEYQTSLCKSLGRQTFDVIEEPENVLTIPLGTCNNYNPVLNVFKKDPGGFIGQWTQLRQQKVEKIISSFSENNCPYSWAFYNGFGPFVQADSTNVSENYSLDSKTYSNFMSKSEVSFVLSGQSPETYRLFEAAAAGSIVVHDILPDLWYYKTLPHVPMNETNFINTYTYIDTHKEDLKMLTGLWYQNYASPVAVGKKIAKLAKDLGI